MLKLHILLRSYRVQTGKSTVKEMFDGMKIFHIPIYQRSYSWEEEDNLKDFLSDIINQHSSRPYFFGTFLLHIQEDRGDFKVIDIVDGQQRLTTFTIFIYILINKLIESSSKIISTRTERVFIKDEDVFKLESSNEDNAFLHNIILSNSLKKEIHTTTSSQDLLLKSKEFFNNQLDKISTHGLERMYKTAINAEVLLYAVNEINSATQIFELLNDRGRPLTDLESIKSFLMYTAGLVSSSPDQVINNIQIEFSEIYRISEIYNISDQDVLRYHVLAFENYPTKFQNKPKDFIKTKIKEMMLNDVTDSKVLEEIVRFSNSLKNSFIIYSEIQKIKYDNHHLSQFFMINRISAFYPALMNIYKNDYNNLNTLIKNINKFTFRASLFSLRSNGETYLYKELKNNGNPINLLNDFVENNWWDINGRSLETIDYGNYYEWINKNIVRYILVSYENKLRNKKGFPTIGLKEFYTTEVREKLSIEHIVSQKSRDIEYDDDFEENYKHNIGNLVIDYAASNSSKSNKNTVHKLKDFNLAPIMSQNEIEHIECNWSDLESIKTFILEREVKIKKFILQEFYREISKEDYEEYITYT